ncbi:MAG: protein phosphatase CheZ [Betaproteobacteria bacterium]|nr:protein phosphatase CheZ [Betaproteobacteria bacterium]
MVAKRKIDETGDSDELQSLFDSIAADGGAEDATHDGAGQEIKPPPAPVPKAASYIRDGDDNDELQALFDTEAGRYTCTPSQADGVADEEGAADHDDTMFHRIGKMTRRLHDMLIELGLDNKLQEVANAIPDTRQRLGYVVQMTEQAASRVLNATDVAKPLIARIQTESGALGARWDRLFGNQLSVEEFKALAEDTRAFLGSTAESGGTIDAQLLEIVMAQDFQDLTGQVIKKVLEMAQELESQLLGILIESAPEDVRTEKAGCLLNGPVIDGEGRDDVVTSQGQVDDLLASLGF